MTLKIGKIVFKSDKNNFSPKTSDKTAKASGLECYIQEWVPFCVCWQYDVIRTPQKHVRFLIQNLPETFRLVAASWPIPIVHRWRPVVPHHFCHHPKVRLLVVQLK